MIYIDSINIPYRNMIMCHMMADTTEELLEMADKIGVNRKWLQYPGSYKEHFDICLSKKAKAIKLGAKEISNTDMGRFILKKHQEFKNEKDN